MPRYIAEYIRPNTGTPALGTLKSVVRHYQSDRNAMRYLAWHLNSPHLPAGQYQVSIWPEHSFTTARHVGTLYKRADGDA